MLCVVLVQFASIYLSAKLRQAPPAPNPCRIRASTNRARDSFMICTSLARPDLRIPKDLPPPNFSRHSFIFCTYKPGVSAENKRLITPLEFMLPKISPATPLKSALPKNLGSTRERQRPAWRLCPQPTFQSPVPEGCIFLHFSALFCTPSQLIRHVFNQIQPPCTKTPGVYTWHASVPLRPPFDLRPPCLWDTNSRSPHRLFFRINLRLSPFNRLFLATLTRHSSLSSAIFFP
jgi:hypothetical protein